MNQRIPRWTRTLLWPGVFLFLVPGIVRTYFLMPFPGSMEPDVIAWMYRLHPLVMPLRILGFLMMILPIIGALARGRWLRRIGVVVLLVVCGMAYYFTEIDMTAEAIFREPHAVKFARGAENAVGPETIVLGIEANGMAKAYPIKYLAYHHKIIDSIGGQPIMPTYCSMCRSGRVFDPVVDGRLQHFRLVGARMYNAVIEDNETKSWWYQETGEAVAGPRAGSQLAEFPCEEMTLRSWMGLHPETLVFQPDPASAEGYEMFSKWDSIRPPKFYWDSAALTWHKRAWVVGVTAGNSSRAFAWKGAIRQRVVNDSIGDVPLVLVVEPDSLSFHVWNRDLHGTVLTFAMNSDGRTMHDASTNSTWDIAGACTAGPLVGQRLTPLRAFREYWHSWKTFHRTTTTWE